MPHYPQPLVPRVHIDGNCVLTYRGRYIPAVVSEFKRFPVLLRDYAPDNGKVWTIKPPYADEALRLILRFAPDAEVEYTQ